MGYRGLRVRRGVALAIALLAALHAQPAAAAAPGPILPEPAPRAIPQNTGTDPYFGYNEDWFSHKRRIRFVARGGADTARAVLSWSAVERRPGVYRWNRYDRLYGRMLANGVRPLWVLGDAPCWARDLDPHTCAAQGHFAFPPPESRFVHFAYFAALVAHRYPEAVAIESWNEPNLWAFWRPQPDPAAAARLTAWVNAGVDSVNPNMPVLLGGLSPLLPSKLEPPKEVAYADFLHRAYAAVGPGHWDAVAMHPFPAFQQSTHYLEDITKHLNRVRRTVARAGGGRPPIWVTEVGLSTAGLRPYTAAQQAKGLVRILRGLAARGDVPAVIVHRVIDQPKSLKTAESGWGIVRHNGNPKPAYCALAIERGERCGRR
jgi:polysaccharide biosynthesis protein PslG